MEPALDFDLVSFPQLRLAPFSRRPIAAASLENRIILLRTERGDIAKMQVRPEGADLLVERLTLYSRDGCIERLEFHIELQVDHWIDIYGPMRSSPMGGDIRWHRGALEPGDGTELFVLPTRAGRVGLGVVAGGDDRIAGAGLRGKPLYCRTSAGRVAKLTVEEAGRVLRIRDLTVLDAEGNVHLQRSGIEVPVDASLDFDSGEVGGAPRDGVTYVMKADGRGGIGTTPGTDFPPAYVYEMLKYSRLLNKSAIRNAMVFEDADGAQSYDEWSDARKTQLTEWLHMRETEQAFPISGPPSLDDAKTMTHCAAWKIYLAHIAQSLWADANDKVPWRLEDANEEHLEHLLDSRKLLLFDSEGHKFSGDVMGLVTDWAPVFSWEFLIANDLVGATQWETIKRVADWVRANLNHITGFQNDNDGGPFDSQEDQWEYIFGYRGPPPVDKMIEPLPGRDHITHGCWGTDGFLAAVLRAANVPLRHGRSNLDDKNHSRAEFFTVSKNFCHGDDPYNALVRLGVNDVPIGRVFMTDQEIEDLIDSPPPLPGKSVGETASFNRMGFLTALAVKYKTNWLLQKRCLDVATNASGPGSQLQQEIGDYYTTQELAQIIQDCDAALAAIPGGCGAVW